MHFCPCLWFCLTGCPALLPCPLAPTSHSAPMKSLCSSVILPAGLGDEGGRMAWGCTPRPWCLSGAWAVEDARCCRGESCKNPQNPNHGCSQQHCPASPKPPQLSEGCCPAPTHPPAHLAHYCLVHYYRAGMWGKHSAWGRAECCC